MRTNTDGNKVCDSRFYPYGEEHTPPCAGDPYKFTGKERDAETGLDYFGARHYGSYLGRFVSTDQFGGFVTNPQSFNRYLYVRNNPLSYVDHDGELAIPVVILGGALIGGAFGAYQAYINGDDILNGTLTGMVAGGAAGLFVNPFLSGAAAGLAGHSFGNYLEGNDIEPQDLLESALEGAAFGAFGGALRKGLYAGTPGPGLTPNPRRFVPFHELRKKGIPRMTNAHLTGGIGASSAHMVYNQLEKDYDSKQLLRTRELTLFAEFASRTIAKERERERNRIRIWYHWGLDENGWPIVSRK